jgi:hypothetical protein
VANVTHYPVIYLEGLRITAEELRIADLRAEI